MKRKNGQPPVEIFSEISHFFSFLEILICCSNNPDIYGYGLRSTNFNDFLLSQGAEQLNLGLWGKLSDLIQENRALAGKFELSRFLCFGVSKSALGMAKKLRLDQVPGDGSTVDYDKRAIFSWTVKSL